MLILTVSLLYYIVIYLNKVTSVLCYYYTVVQKKRANFGGL